LDPGKRCVDCNRLRQFMQHNDDEMNDGF
jgi:hypothetical protein